jgi:hypothetical protein
LNPTYIYNVETSKLIDKIILPENVGSRAKSMSWSPDNQWIIISNDVGMGTFLYSIKSHEIIKIIDFPIDNTFWVVKK